MTAWLLPSRKRYTRWFLRLRVRILDPLSGKRSDGPLSPGRWYDAMVAHAPWLWGLCYHATNNAQTIRLGMAARDAAVGTQAQILP